MNSLSILVLLLLPFLFDASNAKLCIKKLTRKDFPADFIFGSASSAYQYEGAAHEDGKGPSIWDTFSEKHPERIKDHSNGTVADNTYHRYKEDVGIMKDIGFDAYRFSISWSRLLPRGNLQGGVNQAGIDYYNNLIDELLSKGIKPFITLFHWDVPQTLEDRYGGFRSPRIVDDFQNYADLCFEKFGDRVKHWMVLNEPYTFAVLAYVQGTHAPGRCSKFVNPECTGGDSATEPYIVAHNLLLAHAAAVNVYREKYQGSRNGQIGIALNSEWLEPYSESMADRLAAARAMAFNLDWFLEPMTTGHYPADMISHVKGGRLPEFTDQQSSMLKGSFDFIGINYYSSYYAQDIPCQTVNISYLTDSCAKISDKRNGVSIGPKTASGWPVSARGIRDLLLYVKYKFKDPMIYITENGIGDSSSDKNPLDDVDRIKFYATHLQMLQDAVSIGANVKGFFAWSMLDNFEWADGYTIRFGLVYVDYKDDLKRHLKKSARWLGKFLKGN